MVELPFPQEFINAQFPKKPLIIPDPKPSVDKHHGFRFYDFPKSGSSWLTTWKDEENIREEFWYPNLKDAKLVFDVGCDIGSYTLEALSFQSRPYVVAITPENFEEFRLNLDLNGWYDPNRVLPIDAAFYDKKGYLEFQMQHFSINPAANHYRVYTMDDAFLDMNLVPIDMMKIDVEGAELQVLKGAMNLIIRDHPKLLVECHNFKEPGIDEAVVNFLSGLAGNNYEFKRAGHHATNFVYAYPK